MQTLLAVPSASVEQHNPDWMSSSRVSLQDMLCCGSKLLGISRMDPEALLLQTRGGVFVAKPDGGVDPQSEGTWCTLLSVLGSVSCTVRFGSIAKALAKCKLEYYRISECPARVLPVACASFSCAAVHNPTPMDSRAQALLSVSFKHHVPCITLAKAP